MKNRFVTIFSMVILLSCTNKPLQISSPDQTVGIGFSLVDGQPKYAVTKNNKPVIEPSSLGFKILQQTNQINRYKVLSSEIHSVDKPWEQPWGEFRVVNDNHNELIVHLMETGANKSLLDIQFRVFNDGVSFRYSFPEQNTLDSVIILDELTQFTFPEDQNVWWIPVHSENSYYESLYRKNRISETDTINTPATFETKDGLFLSIHEANLTDFASMTLRKTDTCQYTSELVPWSNGVKVYAKTPFVSPWRTLIIAEKPGDLVTSTLMLNLNDSCKLEDVSWIQPSKYIGIWWGMHLEKYTWGQGSKHGATTELTKNYIGFASENGFNGVLVEGWNEGWDGDWSKEGNKFSFTKSYPDFDLEEITSYAVMKNVRLIGHHETGGAATNYENQLEDAFALYHKYGVNAVKTGYVNKYLDGTEWHDSQYGVRHYRKVIETAAKYHIMIDNHEPVKGTGLQRTYPNLMTQEGGRGQEYDAWSSDGGNLPSHTVTLPFTRMLAGPFDFTPGTFNFNYSVREGTRVNTTLAKQLALFVVIYSPQQMASDLPENYVNQPAFQFIRDVAVDWEKTVVTDGQIGQYITVARQQRNSDNWFVGSITNENPRTLTLIFDFLDAGKTYEAIIYKDTDESDWKKNPTAITIEKMKITKDSKINIYLASGGGAAISLIPDGHKFPQ
ncbi:MAG TPA: alpha-glucosidase [Marinilabiliales bacterium]|jgi:alpha-glucosidase|nr:MAG: alpha-glucosidase [Bacteroidetes bacterium GWA2_40_14]OFX58806.1 MAG: alpha-glucosidase [Bacteroidetes bacterium GWC2_40_13]OFX75340.1 MAG: alpha-glucosidase [Bacteroidetes bacterium GWD2_40_43]OFX95416.1 MAG: alpha-glucosidase [Bacteroidetes bacterium GWE2_40_63]OFZ31818.1 MAG: alpha-glucosidase [Bacteroidetes bacterium RIFOXYC2_FULL_40_12]HAM99791.1 alpha-glucosidase [Marinilabiliales bacterium]